MSMDDTEPSVSKSEGRPRHDADYYAWALDQAARLRAVARTGIDTGLDYEHLAEAMIGLARAERDAVRDQLRRVIENLLRLEYSTASEPRQLWELAVTDARATLADKMTASLNEDAIDNLRQLYGQARRIAAADLAAHGEFNAAADLPKTCPYSLEQIIVQGWLPKRRSTGDR